MNHEVPEPRKKVTVSLSIEDQKRLNRIAYEANQRDGESYSASYVIHHLISSASVAKVVDQIAGGAK